MVAKVIDAKSATFSAATFTPTWSSSAQGGDIAVCVWSLSATNSTSFVLNAWAKVPGTSNIPLTNSTHMAGLMYYQILDSDSALPAISWTTSNTGTYGVWYIRGADDGGSIFDVNAVESAITTATTAMDPLSITPGVGDDLLLVAVGTDNPGTGNNVYPFTAPSTPANMVVDFGAASSTAGGASPGNNRAGVAGFSVVLTGTGATDPTAVTATSSAAYVAYTVVIRSARAGRVIPRLQAVTTAAFF